jgi:mono/diheme cytochrome c family protein
MLRGICLPGILAAAAVCSSPGVARTDDPVVARGKYLVQISGCTDCHTPGHFLGKPDMSRYLAGSDVGFEIPAVGTVVGRNLTPDKETGIGSWTVEQIVTAIRSGMRPDGRVLSPVMPWPGFANMTQADATAIATFLRTLPPVKNKISGPFAANETPTTLRWTIVAPQGP